MRLLLLLAIASIAIGQVLHHQGKFYFSDGSSLLLDKLQEQATLPAAAGASLLIEQPVDHFNVSNSTATYMQRYFVNDTQWDKSNPMAPILLCVGGEGPPLDASVLVDSVHCSDMVQYSQQKNSLTFAIEHRFYGSSLPTGMDFSTENLKMYLSTEQAAQDIRSFILKMKANYGIPDSTPWITFGGSYPGMLSAISHQVNPDLIYAAVASSAPLQAVVEFPGYNEVVGEAYTNPLVGGSDACFSVISEGHAQIQKLLATAEGRRQLETDFHVCGRSALDDAMNQVQFASDGVAYFPAQSNDPSCTDDLCNIAKVCSALLAATAGDGSAYSRLIALSRSQNGNACKPVSHDALVAVYLPSNSPSRIWQFQTCSEWGFYMTCPTGSKCPFVQGLASLESSLDICKKAFGIEEATIRDNVDKANARYGGSNFKCERVLFVNGEVDPWRASSVQLDTGYPSEPIHLSLGTSHHFWTHEPLPTDGKYVGDSRTTIFAQLDEWLQQRQQQAKK